MPNSFLANMIVPAASDPISFLLPFLVIVTVESLIAWALIGKVYFIRVRFLAIFLIFLVANFVTSIIGSILDWGQLNLHMIIFGEGIVTTGQTLTVFAILLLVTIIIEWIVLVIAFRTKGLKIKTLRLFLISLLVNAITYMGFMVTIDSLWKFFR